MQACLEPAPGILVFRLVWKLLPHFVGAASHVWGSDNIIPDYLSPEGKIKGFLEHTKNIIIEY